VPDPPFQPSVIGMALGASGPWSPDRTVIEPSALRTPVTLLTL
jgi:hypothetical protein